MNEKSVYSINYKLRLILFSMFIFLKHTLFVRADCVRRTSSFKSCLTAAILTVDFDRWTPDQRAGGETCQHHGSCHLVHVHFLLRPSVETKQKKRRILLSIFCSQHNITHCGGLWQVSIHTPLHHHALLCLESDKKYARTHRACVYFYSPQPDVFIQKSSLLVTNSPCFASLCYIC